MRSTSKDILIEYLNLIIEKANLVVGRNECIQIVHDFLISPERMEKFDAACMLIQVIGETQRKLMIGQLPNYLATFRKYISEMHSDVEILFLTNMAMSNLNKYSISLKNIYLNSFSAQIVS